MAYAIKLLNLLRLRVFMRRQQFFSSFELYVQLLKYGSSEKHYWLNLTTLSCKPCYRSYAQGSTVRG